MLPRHVLHQKFARDPIQARVIDVDHRNPVVLPVEGFDFVGGIGRSSPTARPLLPIGCGGDRKRASYGAF